jgi:hypothetical protein
MAAAVECSVSAAVEEAGARVGDGVELDARRGSEIELWNEESETAGQESMGFASSRILAVVYALLLPRAPSSSFLVRKALG